MTPHPKMSSATAGVGMKMPPCGRRRASDSSEAVSPKRSWNRGPAGAELRRRCHGEIELQCVWQQKHAVDGRPRLEVGEHDRVQLLGERARPTLENVGDLHAVSDPESEVQVGEMVAGSVSERAHSGSGDDA